MKSFTFDDIYNYFENPPKQYITAEEAAALIAYSILNFEGVWIKSIREYLSEKFGLSVSDTAFNSAKKLLIEEEIISIEFRNRGKGKPRHMLVKSQGKNSSEIEKLAKLWETKYCNQ